ncbi:MAG: glycosyltransferase family 4 protein [Planctomycetaceae bacterium]|nr:glycosyltransferase family 4 protein [Planctomycetaceae bacterium]
MRIIQITPGSGDQFYCENCLRDLALVKAMQRAGHDVLMVPLYLPLNLDAAPAVAQTPIFFGGVNVYLQQKLGFFRRTPRWLDQWLDSPSLLRRIGKLSGMTSARELGETTVSMLRGPDGRQLKELARLVDWLKALQTRPDVIVVSNVLLAGLAPALKEALGVPLACWLQDEDGFLDSLPHTYSKKAWQLVSQKAASFDALIAVSGYYQQIMMKRLGTLSERIACIPMGVDAGSYEPAAEAPATPSVGFLSRMGHDYGFDIAAEAVILLRREPELKNLTFRVIGGRTARDESYLQPIRSRLRAEMGDDVRFWDAHDLANRRQFFNGLSVVVVPARKPQAYGMSALEACAAGVPFAAPAIGVFAEIGERTGAGVLCAPNTADRLAQTLKPLLLAKTELFRMGRLGRRAVETVYSIDETVKQMARQLEELRPVV